MKRLAAFLLLAGLSQTPARAADPAPGAPIPTSPQVPVPALDRNGEVIRTSGLRVAMPPRDPVRYAGDAAPQSAPAAPLPAPTGMQVPLGFAPAAPGAADCGTCATGRHARGSCYERFRQWLCFQPTTRDALPKLNPHPYVGPITGTFFCTSGAGCGTGGGAGCPTGACPPGLVGRGGVMPGRGCNGGCVPPADDAIAGYRFAPVESSAVAPGRLAQPAAHTTYKPTAPSAKPAPAPRTAPAPAAAAPVRLPPPVAMPPRSAPQAAAPAAPVAQAPQSVVPAGYGVYTPVWSAAKPIPPIPKP
jgi:hypothetical protein